MDKRIREKLERRIDGFEERQRQRNEARALQLRQERERRLLSEHGTLRGARAYLNRKRVSFEESREPSTGQVFVIVPGQVVLVYDRNGKYVGSGPAKRHEPTGAEQNRSVGGGGESFDRGLFAKHVETEHRGG